MPFLIDSPTNQIFPILSNEMIDRLSQRFDFYVWEKVDPSHSAIRLVTSWATSSKSATAFIDAYLSGSVNTDHSRP